MCDTQPTTDGLATTGPTDTGPTGTGPTDTSPTVTGPGAVLSEVAGVVIGHVDDYPLNQLRMAKVGDDRVCIVRTGEGVFATDQACPHEGYGLSTGSFDGQYITCQWHNWKFRARDGLCVQGEENVAAHRVRVGDDGIVAVSIVRPSLTEARTVALASLMRGIENDYLGQIARDVVRLLHLDVAPVEIVASVVDYAVGRNEWGWGHEIAALTDCAAMVRLYDGDDRALPLVQGIAGVAEECRDRSERPLPAAVGRLPHDTAEAFRAYVEDEDAATAQALVLAAIRDGIDPDEIRSWLTAVVCDHHLSTGHGAIYIYKAFELLEMIGWDHAPGVLGHLVVTLVAQTREDLLPYMVPFRRIVDLVDLIDLAGLAGRRRDPAWNGQADLEEALLGPDRSDAARATLDALDAGAGVDGVLDVIVTVASRRLLRYDVANEDDDLDDFSWLSITHSLTYANAIRWHLDRDRRHGVAFDADRLRLVLWGAFAANWSGRHEWHTVVAPEAVIEGVPGDLSAYATELQRMAIDDSATSFIWFAHCVKTSRAAGEEARRVGSSLPLDAAARFVAGPHHERPVSGIVARSIEFVAGHPVPVEQAAAPHLE